MESGGLPTQQSHNKKLPLPLLSLSLFLSPSTEFCTSIHVHRAPSHPLPRRSNTSLFSLLSCSSNHADEVLAFSCDNFPALDKEGELAAEFVNEGLDVNHNDNAPGSVGDEKQRTDLDMVSEHQHLRRER